MTPQEQEMIDGLVDRIRKTQVTDKDSAAEQRLQQGLAGYPDAVYVLAQTVLVQQYGLGQAQSQITELKQQTQTLQDQLQQAAEHAKSSGSGGGFLSHIFGSGSSSSPAPQPGQAPPYQPVNNPGYSSQPYPTQGYPPPPPAYPQQGYPAPSSGGMFGGGGGGFLQGAMQTAAGVAAGEMMFQGMESLFHGFERGGGGGYGLSGGMGGGETVVNNYYDDDRSAGGDREDRGRDEGGRADTKFYNPSDDASRSDSGDTGAQFADTGNDNSGADFSGNDDSNFDDSSSNDAGFNDNSGSDDSGGGF